MFYHIDRRNYRFKLARQRHTCSAFCADASSNSLNYRCVPFGNQNFIMLEGRDGRPEPHIVPGVRCPNGPLMTYMPRVLHNRRTFMRQQYVHIHIHLIGERERERMIANAAVTAPLGGCPRLPPKSKETARRHEWKTIAHRTGRLRLPHLLMG